MNNLKKDKPGNDFFFKGHSEKEQLERGQFCKGNIWKKGNSGKEQNKKVNSETHNSEKGKFWKAQIWKRAFMNRKNPNKW